MTQQPWGGAPNQWGGGPAPWPTQPPQHPQQPAHPQYPPPQQPLYPQQQRAYQQAQYAQQQYQQQYQWPPPQPPRRRRSAFGVIVRVALIIVVVAFGFQVIRGIAGVLTDPTNLPTGGTAGQGGSGTGTGSGTTQYQNEGYQAPPPEFDPPSLPQPKTYSQAENWLVANEIYSGSVPSPTRCTMTPIEEGQSKTEMQGRLNDLVGCLMQVWDPPMQAAGYEMPRPPVTVYTSPVTTACGVMKEVNAAYCAGDQQIYYALPLLDALPPQVAKTKYAAEDVIAHEFGHAVQARTGILVSDKVLEQRASDSEARVMSRRAEQQADCFGGLFVESVATSQNLSNDDLQALVDMTYYLGDDALGAKDGEGDHGTGRNRQIWFAKGVQTNQIGVCNTWVVPASQVR